MSALRAKVARVHIGTHQLGRGRGRSALLGLFGSAGFVNEWDFPSLGPHCRTREQTRFGPVCFADGVLSFRNPRLAALSVHNWSAYPRPAAASACAAAMPYLRSAQVLASTVTES